MQEAEPLAAGEIKEWPPRGGRAAACPLSSSWLPALNRACCAALGTAEASLTSDVGFPQSSCPSPGSQFEILDCLSPRCY